MAMRPISQRTPLLTLKTSNPVAPIGRTKATGLEVQGEYASNTRGKRIQVVGAVFAVPCPTTFLRRNAQATAVFLKRYRSIP